MIWIAHRGNINGRHKSRENNPVYIVDAIIGGFKVEVDIRVIDDRIMLGHDEPTYEIDKLFIHNYEYHILWHCKNIEAVELCQTFPDSHYVWHQEDDYTLTSHKYIFTKPGSPLVKNSIAVMPELVNYTYDQLTKCSAICSDNLIKYITKLTPHNVH